MAGHLLSSVVLESRVGLNLTQVKKTTYYCRAFDNLWAVLTVQSTMMAPIAPGSCEDHYNKGHRNNVIYTIFDVTGLQHVFCKMDTSPPTVSV